MEVKDKDVMRKMHLKLVQELDTTGLLLDYLYQEKVLTDEDVEKIKAKKTSKKRAEKLLKILKKRRRGLKMLIKALILTKVQDFLGFEILKKTTWSEEDKKSFEQELYGKLDEQQKLKSELAAANRKIQQLESRCLKYERRFKEKDKKLEMNQSSRGHSISSAFRKFFRRSHRNLKEDKAINTGDTNFTPKNGSTCLQVDVIAQSTRPWLDIMDDPFEAPSVPERTNSASGSIISPFGRADDTRISITRLQRANSVPVPWKREDRRPGSHTDSRKGSRTGSIVSSASFIIRNALGRVRKNQDSDRYSNLSHDDSIEVIWLGAQSMIS